MSNDINTGSLIDSLSRADMRRGLESDEWGKFSWGLQADWMIEEHEQCTLVTFSNFFNAF
jgi:hypothetical protein